VTRVFLTGGGGFIGANLARAWSARGVDVHLALRSTSDLWRLEGCTGVQHIVDLRDSERLADLIALVEPDVIVNAAAHGAYSWQTDSDQIIDVNLKVVSTLLQAARAARVARFIQLGTSSEYGSQDGAATEDSLLRPNSLYATTKAAATHLIQNASDRGDIAATSLRLFSVYGAWEEPGRLMPTIVLAGLRHRLPPLVAPTTARDFVHIDDVVRIVDLFAIGPDISPRPTVVNVGSGVQTTMSELVELVRTQFAIDDKPVWGSMSPRPWDTDRWQADISRAALTGWHPTTTLTQGLTALGTWIEPFRAIYEPRPSRR